MNVCRTLAPDADGFVMIFRSVFQVALPDVDGNPLVIHYFCVDIVTVLVGIEIRGQFPDMISIRFATCTSPIYSRFLRHLSFLLF